MSSVDVVFEKLRCNAILRESCQSYCNYSISTAIVQKYFVYSEELCNIHRETPAMKSFL